MCYLHPVHLIRHALILPLSALSQISSQLAEPVLKTAGPQDRTPQMRSWAMGPAFAFILAARSSTSCACTLAAKACLCQLG